MIVMFCSSVFASETDLQSTIGLIKQALESATWYEALIILLPVIHMAASAIVAATGTPPENSTWGKVYKVIEFIAGVTEKTKQVAPDKVKE